MYIYTRLSIQQLRLLNSRSPLHVSSVRCIHQTDKLWHLLRVVGPWNKPAPKDHELDAQVDEKAPKKPVVIPTRIERSPTDVLKALSGTVSRDYTAAHYKFHDDPFLIPSNNALKRMYALSKDSGKKSAKWIRQEHPELFYHINSEPPVMAYLPNPTLANASEMTEDTIQSFINLGLLSDAIESYRALKSQSEVSRKTKQNLLEMTAFYNEINPSDDDLLEEKWFERGYSETPANTWKMNGIAEELFHDLNPPDSRCYSAIIRGTAKYGNADRAMKLFKEARSHDIKLSTPTYNAVIGIINSVVQAMELRLERLQEILKEMNDEGLQPDSGTLYESLQCAAYCGNLKVGKDMQRQLLAEFKNIGIEPTLSCYDIILASFCRTNGPKSTILVDIMDQLEGKELYIQHRSDTNFFKRAMEVCAQHLHDVELANRVHQLLLTGRNYDLIGNGQKESAYYRAMFKLHIHSSLLHDFFEIYDKLVPNIYVPEMSVMLEILNVVKLNSATQYIPRLFSDMLAFDSFAREEPLSLIIEIINDNYPLQDGDENIKLATTFGDIAWKTFVMLETQTTDPNSSSYIYWNGKMLGNVLSILVKAERLEQADEIMKKLLRPQEKIIGVISLGNLRIYLESHLKSNNGVMCLACAQYANEAGYAEVNEIAEEILQKVTLDSVQTAKLKNIVGFDQPKSANVKSG